MNPIDVFAKIIPEYDIPKIESSAHQLHSPTFALNQQCWKLFMFDVINIESHQWIAINFLFKFAHRNGTNFICDIFWLTDDWFLYLLWTLLWITLKLSPYVVIKTIHINKQRCSLKWQFSVYNNKFSMQFTLSLFLPPAKSRTAASTQISEDKHTHRFTLREMWDLKFQLH